MRMELEVIMISMFLSVNYFYNYNFVNDINLFDLKYIYTTFLKISFYDSLDFLPFVFLYNECMVSLIFYSKLTRVYGIDIPEDKGLTNFDLIKYTRLANKRFWQCFYE